MIFEFLSGFTASGFISLALFAWNGDARRAVKSFLWSPLTLLVPLILRLVFARPAYGDTVLDAYGVPSEFFVYGLLAGVSPFGQTIENKRPLGESLLTIATCIAAALYFGFASLMARQPVPNMPETYIKASESAAGPVSP